jgi:hypothetical protein
MATDTKTKPHPLDPDTDTPRQYLVNVTTRLVHRTDRDDPACRPAVEDAIGWGDELLPFFRRDTRFPALRPMIACSICVPTVSEAEKAALKERLSQLDTERKRLSATAALLEAEG